MSKYICKFRKITSSLLLMAFVLFALVLSPTKSSAATPGIPSNPNASPDAVKVYNYLTNLNKNSFTGLIVGQQVGTPGQILLDANYFASYAHEITNLYNTTGKYPGMIGVEYQYDREFTQNEILAANTVIKDYWNNGGLITIGFSPTNPFGTAQDWSDINTVKPDPNVDLYQLLPNGNKRTEWLAKLDKIAYGLQDLQNAGVVVLFRPMQEMNGLQFWWGKNAAGDTHSDYIDVYRDMYNYFTVTKGLNNLLWVFSPALTNAWSSYPYPGDNYVDIVAPTNYSDTLDLKVGNDPPGSGLSSYDNSLAYGRAIGQGEWGQDPWDGTSGNYDNRNYINKAASTYPKMPYCLVWGNWSGTNMALYDNNYKYELLNDSRVITRGDSRLNWRDTNSSNKALNPGFETGSGTNWSLWNTTVVSGNQHGGSYSGRLPSGACSFNQTITGLAPNTTYTLTGWCKEAAGETVYLGVKDYGGTETNVGFTSTSYQQQTVTFTTGASNTSATIYFYKASGTGTSYCDDVSVKQTNMASNPGFETGSGTNWALWNTTVVSGNQHGGSYSGRLPSGACSFNQTITGLAPNTTYTLTGWCKEASGDTVNLGVKDYGGSETSVGFTSTSYQQQTVTFTTGASNTSATIYFYKASGTGTSYCDDISVSSN